jgi:hypothetical protein
MNLYLIFVYTFALRRTGALIDKKRLGQRYKANFENCHPDNSETHVEITIGKLSW